jgi:plastocyanin
MRQIAAAGTAALCLALAGCGGDGNDATPGAASSAPAPTSAAPSAPVALAGTVNVHETKDLAGRDEFELEMDDFYFGPTFVKGTPGATVKVELANEGENPHTFTIDSLKVDTTVQPGKATDVSVKLPASGALAFYCKFHKGQGMQGAFFFNAGDKVIAASSTEDNGGAYGG